MVMQGISPSGEKKVIDIASIATGADTTTCMMGGRFCVFTVSGALSTDVTLDLCCGGEDTRYLPTSANKQVSIEVAANDTVACVSVDMGGYQSFKVKTVTGLTAGTLIIEPMWC